MAFAQAFELDLPWMSGASLQDAGDFGGNASGEGIWSPGDAAPDSDAGQKLWIPGQS